MSRKKFPRKKWTEDDILFVKENYGKITANEIAEKIQHSTSNIETLARKKLGIKSNLRFLPVRSMDHEFFDTPNMKNSYWAGFIAADGSIQSEKRYKNGSASLKIEISNKDCILLERFKEDLKYDGNIHISTKKDKQYCNICVVSNKICLALRENFNIVENKTLILKPPNLTDLDLKLAYIAGFIDGDGSIGLRKDRNEQLLQLIGTKQVLDWMKEMFDNIAPAEKAVAKVRKYKKTQNSYLYSTSGFRAEKILKIIKEKTFEVPKLPRKWDNIKNSK